MKKTIALLLTLLLTLSVCVSCGTEPQKTSDATLCGVDIADYTIVYSASAPDYNQTAAEYIRDSIKEKVGVELPIVTDDTAQKPHEILVGETMRPLSALLDADTEGLSFATLANETGVAIEGDFFVIAAAAYYFVDTYITGKTFSSVVPDTVSVNAPIVESPKNFIFLIGDGMGVYQTQLFDYVDRPESSILSDGEDIFYAHMLPYKGESRTDSLSGTTDSAAGGTALASGYKTTNGFVGMDENLKEVKSLTELADSLGKATAVMSTEDITGATPAAFSAHAASRNSTSDIKKSQRLLENTVLQSLVNSYGDELIETLIAQTLSTLSADEDGFFIMYEEAHIDKHCHNNDFEWTYKALCRFNQAIGQFMEFAFYHPDTLVLITADHETGDLRPDKYGDLKYHSEDHSNANVPVFAYGEGAEIFDGKTMENVQIPKTIAYMWGQGNFGDLYSPYSILK